jgi:hypothetical protein
MAFSAELGVVLNHCRRAMVQAGGGKDLSLDGFTCELSGEAVATLPTVNVDLTDLTKSAKQIVEKQG